MICRAMIGLLDGLVYPGRVCTVLSKCFVLASPYCLHDGCRKRQQHPHSQLLRFQMGLHKVQTASKCLWSSRSNLVSGSFSRILHCSAVHTRQQWCHSDARSHDITGKSYQEGCWPFLADHQHAAEQCAVRILITPSLHISEFRVCSSYLHLQVRQYMQARRSQRGCCPAVRPSSRRYSASSSACRRRTPTASLRRSPQRRWYALCFCPKILGQSSPKACLSCASAK